MFAQKSRTGHNLGTHQNGGNHKCESGSPSLLRGKSQHGELQERAIAGEIVKPGAGHLRTPIHIDETERDS